MTNTKCTIINPCWRILYFLFFEAYGGIINESSVEHKWTEVRRFHACTNLPDVPGMDCGYLLS